MRLWTLAAVLLLASGVAGAVPGATRAWLVAALEGTLEEPAADLNRVASLLFPLAAEQRRNPSPALAGVLARTRDALARRDAAALDCNGLADLHLSAAFLREAGLAFDPAQAARLADCRRGENAFAAANALLAACRYGLPLGADERAESIARLRGRQLADGAFAGADGRGHFYLTTHALLALHHCGGSDAAVERARRRLLEALPGLTRGGLLDGLAEALIFLRWTGEPAPDAARYRDYIASRVQPDGSLCFRDVPGCPGHWHATSLLLELNAGGL